MDSGSGSMQSSSGGDDEYDSRAESISALLSNPPSQLGHMSSHPPPHHHHHHHHQQQTHHHLDPLSNMFDPLSSRLTNPNPLLNFDMAWSKTLRSDPNPTDLGGLSQPFLTNPNINQLGQSRGGGGGGGGSSTFAALQIPHDHQNVSASSSAQHNQTHNINSNSNNNNNSNSNGVVRNPKKRSRASRRAPTTVLTTDTTNFRAMVQEFTGIPAPPFTSSSAFPRSRLDLFSSAAAASALMRSAGGGGGGGGLGLEPSTPYLLRPFAHKVSHQPPSSSSILDHPNLPSTNSSATNHHNNLLNMQQNPSPSSSSVLNFQSLFQPQHQQQQPKYSLPINSPNDLLASKTPHHHHHQGSLDHFGLTQQQLNVLPNNIVSSSDAALSRHDSNSNWGNGTGPSNNNKTNIDNNNVDHQGLMRSINGNYGNGKLNYSAGSSSNNIIHGDKTQDQNVAAAAARSEGMVESWICSSD